VAAILEARSITKRFPGVVALDEVDLSVEAGSCHALMGENGAGKSTFIINGRELYQPDEGEVIFEGRAERFTTPTAALRAGISMVHQELVFCENLSVAENLSLDRFPKKGLFLDRTEMIRRATEWLDRIGADVDPRAPVGELPIAKRQLVQIAGAVGRGARLIVFDEPTSSLSQHEVNILFEQIRALKAGGVTCVYVSHRLEEVYELCDTVTVLRDGRLVATRPIADVDRSELVCLMIGRELEMVDSMRSAGEPGEVALEVRNLDSPGRFEDVTFTVRRGEIVGFAGLVGSGRTEIVETVFGLDSQGSGQVRVGGRLLIRRSPAASMRAGLGMIPEDRKRNGLVLSMNARENISLPTLNELARLGWIASARERRMAEEYFRALRVKAPSIESGVEGLSGGNQQKVVIAKWLAANCEVLILDEPTRGVDVGAKAEIHELIRGLARGGKAIVVISSDLPELLALSTRFVVVRLGRLVGELPGEGADEEALMRLMTGVESESRTSAGT